MSFPISQLRNMDEVFLDRLELFDIVQPLVRPPAHCLFSVVGKQSVKEILQNPRVICLSAFALYVGYKKYKRYQDRKRQEALKREMEEMSNSGSGSSHATPESCVICMSNPIGTVVIPCGHVCMCLLCSKEVHKINYTCPICRENIAQIRKIYFP